MTVAPTIDPDLGSPWQEHPDLAWLFEVLGVDQEGPERTYLGRRRVDDLQLLLPLDARRAAAAALGRLPTDRSWRDRAEAVLASGGARLGLLGFAPGDRLTIPSFGLIRALARALGEPELQVAVTMGPRRRIRKPVLQLIQPGGTVVGFAKVGWSPLTDELVTNETAVLEQLADELSHPVLAPEVLVNLDWQGHPVTVLSDLRRTGGPNGSRAPLRTRPSPSPTRTISAALGMVAAIGRRTDRPASDLAVLDEAQRLGVGDLVDLDRVRDRHHDVALRTGLWHGDATPWNLALRGTEVLLWDWELAGWDRPVGFDALHRRFEHHRRTGPIGIEQALAATVADAGTALAQLADPAPNRRQQDAMLDLYLCELIGRELRLDGQRWTATDLEPLAGPAADLLDRRLRR